LTDERELAGCLLETLQQVSAKVMQLNAISDTTSVRVIQRSSGFEAHRHIWLPLNHIQNTRNWLETAAYTNLNETNETESFLVYKPTPRQKDTAHQCFSSMTMKTMTKMMKTF